MGRGKGILARKEGTDENGMVVRRSFMDNIQPFPTLPSKRSYAEHNLQQASIQAHVPRLGYVRWSAVRPLSYKRPRTTATPKAFSKDVTQEQNEISINSDTPKLEPYPHPSKQPVLNLLYAPFKALDVDKILTMALKVEKVFARIHVPTEHLTASNPAVKARHLWGYDWYTDDSDIVAVLIHSRNFQPTVKPPDTYQYLSVLIEVQKFQQEVHGEFPARIVNGLASREWSSSFTGAAIRITSVAMVRADTAEIPACKQRNEVWLRLPRLVPWKGLGRESQSDAPPRDGKGTAKRSCLIGGVMTFDLANEPCLVYDLKEVSSIERADGILHRLRSEVLYVENSRHRWELALTDADGDGTHVRVARVTDETMRHLRLSSLHIWQDGNHDDDSSTNSNNDDRVKAKLTVPLTSKQLDVIAKRILWTDLVWDLTGVTVNGNRLKLTKLSFRKRT